jgi:hypothetical protein
LGNLESEAERCAVCGARFGYFDDFYFEFFQEFAKPRWLDSDVQWCAECVCKRFEEDHPDFESTGLWPDTYLIWKEAADLGFDIEAQLAEIEESAVIRRLFELVGRDGIHKWIISDIPSDDLEYWADVFDDVEDALEWHRAGFNPILDEVGIWVDWGCSPEAAKGYQAQGLSEPPGAHYRELKLDFPEAVLFALNGFSDDIDSDDYIGLWLLSQLESEEIVKLRDELARDETYFQELHEASATRPWAHRDTPTFWAALPSMFAALQQARLRVTPVNLRRFWGLDSSEILDLIDSGVSVQTGVNALRQGIDASQVPLLSRLSELGICELDASVLVKQGLTMKDVKQLQKNGQAATSLKSLVEILSAVSQMSAGEGLQWIDAGVTGWDVRPWVNSGFDAATTKEWLQEGFSPFEAKRWIEVGASSPTVAKRRRDAGIEIW